MKTETQKIQIYADLKGADLSGQDLSGWDFTRADLTGANLEGAILANTDFRCAILDDARISNTSLVKCNFTGASVNALLQDCHVDRSVFIGADLHAAHLEGVRWNTNGSRTRGILMPPFDPRQLSWANDCHDTVVRLLLWEFPGDFQIKQLTEFILARSFPCWSGFVDRIEQCYTNRIPEIESAFSRYPSWSILERWRLAVALKHVKSADDVTKLKASPAYKLFPEIIDYQIRERRT